LESLLIRKSCEKWMNWSLSVTISERDSEIVEAMLTAFIQSETNHVERVREIIIRKRKGTL
jgi:hypothetical protein